MSNEDFGAMILPRLIPIIAFIAVIISRSARKNKYAKPRASKPIVKPVLNGKAARGKAFGQRPKGSNYKSAFENKGLLSGGTVSAFGDSRDVISRGSLAAINAEYMDVGNDYVSSFDVGGYRETPIGFDR